MEDATWQFARYGADWIAELEDLFAHVGHRFGRREMQERALDYLIGLLSPLERKNGWQLAEAADRPSPYSLQHLPDRAHWDANTVRDDLVDYVVEQLRTTVSTLEQALSVRTLEIEQLQLQIAKLKRMQFGRKSEKIDRKLDQLETRLEDLLAEEGAAEQKQPQTVPPGRHRLASHCLSICRAKTTSSSQRSKPARHAAATSCRCDLLPNLVWNQHRICG